jgi:hypothetical protein
VLAKELARRPPSGDRASGRKCWRDAEPCLETEIRTVVILLNNPAFVSPPTAGRVTQIPWKPVSYGIAVLSMAVNML